MLFFRSSVKQISRNLMILTRMSEQKKRKLDWYVFGMKNKMSPFEWTTQRCCWLLSVRGKKIHRQIGLVKINRRLFSLLVFLCRQMKDKQNKYFAVLPSLHTDQWKLNERTNMSGLRLVEGRHFYGLQFFFSAQRKMKKNFERWLHQRVDHYFKASLTYYHVFFSEALETAI